MKRFVFLGLSCVAFMVTSAHAQPGPPPAAVPLDIESDLSDIRQKVDALAAQVASHPGQIVVFELQGSMPANGKPGIGPNEYGDDTCALVGAKFAFLISRDSVVNTPPGTIPAEVDHTYLGCRF